MVGFVRDDFGCCVVYVVGLSWIMFSLMSYQMGFWGFKVNEREKFAIYVAACRRPPYVNV